MASTYWQHLPRKLGPRTTLKRSPLASTGQGSWSPLWTWWLVHMIFYHQHLNLVRSLPSFSVLPPPLHFYSVNNYMGEDPHIPADIIWDRAELTISHLQPISLLYDTIVIFLVFIVFSKFICKTKIVLD